jgi:hypothetical protein
MRSIKKPTLLFLALAALSAAGACGGDSDDGEDSPGDGDSSQVDTGLPPDMVLGDVTPAQYTQACEAAKANITARLNPDTLGPKVCDAVGASLVNSPDQCRTLSDACTQQLADGTNPAMSRDDLDFSNDIQCDGEAPDLEDCGVTVAQFETCTNDSIAAVEQVFADLGCANAAAVDMDALNDLLNLQTMATPASCQPIQSQCPNLVLLSP